MKIKFAAISLFILFFAVHCPPGQVKKHFNPGHTGIHPGKGNKHR